jgi:shikimate kinase
MKPVFLIGYMGCGKTTLGEVLARQMGVPFIDLDEYIEHQQGMTIVEIFASDGEARFRELETAALRDVAAAGGAIVACGGGTPCHGDNMALMNQTGITVNDTDVASTAITGCANVNEALTALNSKITQVTCTVSSGNNKYVKVSDYVPDNAVIIGIYNTAGIAFIPFQNDSHNWFIISLEGQTGWTRTFTIMYTMLS